MNMDKKLALLIKYDELPELKMRHFIRLISLSRDRDSYVRGRVAVLLINFENNISKKILLKLACDKNSLVRTEAYDSIHIFVCKDVMHFLRNAILTEKISWPVHMQFYPGQILQLNWMVISRKEKLL